MATSVEASPILRRPRWSKRAQREFIAGLLFSAPWLIGLVVFIAYPMITTLYYSLTRYEIPLEPRWIGWKNYVDLFTGDRFFPKVLYNSAFLTFIGIPAQLVFALLCALLLNLKVRGQVIWRTIYILPTLMPPVALALLWRWILNPELGLVNNALKAIGITGPLWFASPLWSKPSIIIMQMWAVGAMTIIYLAALQGVPQELYEAAEIDGASTTQQFWSITLPLISPVTLFQLITGVIWSLQFFTEAYIIGGAGTSPGAPEGSLLFYGLYLYVQAFQYLNMGYAAAMAWILFAITALVTWLLLRVSRRWTSYDLV
ncbi:MAG: sugar ABC transporter permease [Chloroflexi bacterium]|nr:sugar ABC transporter permease [Chloroflexota bacterium]